MNSFASVFISACSNNERELKVAFSHALFLKTHEDKLKKNSKCIEILTTKAREELYIKYISLKIPNININHSSSELNLKQCKLKLIKIHNSSNKKTQISNKSHRLNFIQFDSKTEKKEEIQLSTLEKKESSIRFNEDSLYIKCDVKRNGYQIELWSDSSNFQITNSFYLNLGGYKKIGSYNRSTKNKNKKIQIMNNKFQSNKESTTITLYLKALN